MQEPTCRRGRPACWREELPGWRLPSPACAFTEVPGSANAPRGACSQRLVFKESCMEDTFLKTSLESEIHLGQWNIQSKVLHWPLHTAREVTAPGMPHSQEPVGLGSTRAPAMLVATPGCIPTDADRCSVQDRHSKSSPRPGQGRHPPEPGRKSGTSPSGMKASSA